MYSTFVMQLCNIIIFHKFNFFIFFYLLFVGDPISVSIFTFQSNVLRDMQVRKRIFEKFRRKIWTTTSHCIYFLLEQGV